MKFLKFIILFFCTSLYSQDYFYPVAQLDSDRFICMDQKEGRNIQVVLWSKKTTKKEKLLSSSYVPFGVRLLPNKSGFSFIDNGRIRVKKFHKRCPQSLDLYYPLYNFTLLHWIDSVCFYASAKYCDNYGLYQIGVDGNVSILLEKEGIDYLYPQKIDDLLFYVERVDGLYSIKSAAYPLMKKDLFIDGSCSFEEKVALLLEQENKEKKIEIDELQSLTIISSQKDPILFLTMASNSMGFYLTHKAAIDKNDKAIKFFYHQINLKSGIWSDEKLFSFSVPLEVLTSDSKKYLQESIFPLVPRYNYENNSIKYFIFNNRNYLERVAYVLK